MKKLILLLSVVLASCIDHEIKPNGTNSSMLEVFESDTTFVVQSLSYGQVINFDSSFVVTSINVSYNEPASIFTTQRMFDAEFIDNNYSSILQYDTVITNNPQVLYGFLFQTQNITFDSLYKRCNTLYLWGQPNSNLFTTFTIKGHYSTDDDNEIITVLLDDDGATTSILELNDTYKIKSIKVQHVGRSNRSFSILNNDSTISISDNSSVTNVKDYNLNQPSNSLTFSMTYIPYNDSDIYSFGQIFCTVVIEK